MVLINKQRVLQEVENVPVLCSSCGQHTELLAPNDTVRSALIEASYIRSFEQEIALMYRAQKLFEGFPTSRHPIKINHLYAHSSSERLNVHSDREFAKALADDPELNIFLRQSSFLLPVRLAAITEARESWDKQLDDTVIQCAACNRGHYLIEPGLFDHLVNGSWELAHHP